MRPEWNGDETGDIIGRSNDEKKRGREDGYKILTQAEPKPTTMTFGDS